MEFQPGDQQNGIRAAGGFSDVPSIEKESAESGSSGVFGSEILMLTGTAVRPLSRSGERGILAPAIRNAAEGAAHDAGANSGNAFDRAASTSSSFCQQSGFNQRQLARTSFCGTKTWRNLWARPSLLMNVPSDSAKVPAGNSNSAFWVVALAKWSRTITCLAAPRKASTSAAGARR